MLTPLSNYSTGYKAPIRIISNTAQLRRVLLFSKYHCWLEQSLQHGCTPKFLGSFWVAPEDMMYPSLLFFFFCIGVFSHGKVTSRSFFRILFRSFMKVAVFVNKQTLGSVTCTRKTCFLPLCSAILAKLLWLCKNIAVLCWGLGHSSHIFTSSYEAAGAWQWNPVPGVAVQKACHQWHLNFPVVVGPQAGDLAPPSWLTGPLWWGRASWVLCIGCSSGCDWWHRTTSTRTTRQCSSRSRTSMTTPPSLTGPPMRPRSPRRMTATFPRRYFRSIVGHVLAVVCLLLFFFFSSFLSACMCFLRQARPQLSGHHYCYIP